MAHFAKMEGNVVERVEAVHNDCAPDEATGVAFMRVLYGQATNWVQCSYNASIRKQYPGIGYTYDPIADVFVQPQPYPSWTLDANHDWQPPTPYPDDGGLYAWDEPTQTWVGL